MRRPKAKQTWLNRVRSNRAVGFIFFAVVGIPVVMFTLAIGVDLTRIIMASRQVSLAAQAAALSGAAQYYPGTVVLNTDQASQAAQDTYCFAFDQRAVSQAKPEIGGGNSSGDVTADCRDGYAFQTAFSDYQGADITRADGTVLAGQGYRTITVKVHYEVSGLLFAQFMLGSKDSSFSTYVAPQLSRSASVCVPGDVTTSGEQGTGGYCAPPRTVN